MKKRFLAMFLALVMCLVMLPTAAVAEEIPTSGTWGENLTWKLENGTLTISGSGEMATPQGAAMFVRPAIGYPWYRLNDKVTAIVLNDGITSIAEGAFTECVNAASVTIPNSVTSIGGGAFLYCTSLTSVTIPNGVTSIGNSMFNSCISLTSVSIPDSVTSIGERAFCDCIKLTSVTIPGSVTNIKEYAFCGCDRLPAFQVAPDSQSYLAIDGVLFTKDGMSLLAYPGGKPGAYTIPNGVTSISSGAFEDCKGLTSLTIPDSVTSIGENAFKTCENLTSVTIPGSVTQMGENMFYECKRLTNVNIGNGLTYIRDQAFTNCESLTSVTIPDSIIKIEKNAFFGCDSLTSVTIPNSVISIGDQAFADCKGLTSVTIPDSVTYIGSWAFSSCSALRDIYYGGTEDQWKEIKSDPMRDFRNSLTSVSIHCSGTRPAQPSNLPTVENIPAAGTAVARTQSVLLDGKTVQFQYYAVKNAAGNETNYVKLRDLAQALNGTKAQFNVGWDGKISITSNTPYVAVGGEGSTPYTGDQSYKAVSDTPVSFNGSSVNLTSFSISYQGGGYTYYKLRDLGQLLNFNVMWNGSSIVVESDKPYTG